MRVQVPPSAHEIKKENKDGIGSRPFFLPMRRQPKLPKPKHLTEREWYCVLIASHFAAGSRMEAKHILSDAVKRPGISERLFSELFLHVSLLLGFPSMLEGLSALRSIAPMAKTSGRTATREDVVTMRGWKSLKRVYGRTLNCLLLNLNTLHHEVPDMIIRDVYGRIVSRPGLSLREREIVNVVVLSIQRLDEQLYSHIRGALRLKVSETSLRIAIRTASKISRSDLRTPLRLLSSLSKARKSIR
jgi:alkylhydroperoxidase/carboxymuconolactone decarboxylase family protein YurZ